MLRTPTNGRDCAQPPEFTQMNVRPYESNPKS